MGQKPFCNNVWSQVQQPKKHRDKETQQDEGRWSDVKLVRIGLNILKSSFVGIWLKATSAKQFVVEGCEGAGFIFLFSIFPEDNCLFLATPLKAEN